MKEQLQQVKLEQFQLCLLENLQLRLLEQLQQAKLELLQQALAEWHTIHNLAIMTALEQYNMAPQGNKWNHIYFSQEI